MVKPCFNYLTNINSFNLYSSPVKAHVSSEECDLPKVMYLRGRAGQKATGCYYIDVGIKDRSYYIKTSLSKIEDKMIYREIDSF